MHLTNLSLPGLLCLAALLLLPACKSSQSAPPGENSAETEMPTNPTAQEPADCRPIQRRNQLPQSDPYQLDSLYIEGQCIVVTITYSGGCEAVEANLYFDGKIKKTKPPQANLYFDFDDDDPCEALVTKTFRFDLSSVELLSQQQIVLLFPQHERSLVYTP